MNESWKRRDFLRLAGVGGVIFASGLVGCATRDGAQAANPLPLPDAEPGAAAEDFFFLQLTDTHWGYRGDANPEAAETLRRAVAAINASEAKPDFIVFTGDLTQMTGDAKERRARMREMRAIVGELGVKTLRFLPGEHDASLDRGEAYREIFGEPSYAFDHKGVHFVALDNVSSPAGLGDEQLGWLAADLARIPATVPVVVFSHRPLFDLYPEWDWATKDGARALEILSKRDAVSAFYGHIHQAHERTTGRIVHRATRSLIFPLPAAGSAPKRAPLPWNPESKDHGLGYRSTKRAGVETTEVVLR